MIMGAHSSYLTVTGTWLTDQDEWEAADVDAVRCATLHAVAVAV